MLRKKTASISCRFFLVTARLSICLVVDSCCSSRRPWALSISRSDVTSSSRTDVLLTRTTYQRKQVHGQVTLPDNKGKYHGNEAFPLMKCIDDMCRMGRWSFWSWFDVNRPTFDEDLFIYLFEETERACLHHWQYHAVQ